MPANQYLFREDIPMQNDALLKVLEDIAVSLRIISGLQAVSLGFANPDRKLSGEEYTKERWENILALTGLVDDETAIRRPQGLRG
jgi:hypothetical protein